MANVSCLAPPNLSQFVHYQDIKKHAKTPFIHLFQATEEDSGTETDDETGGPDEGKTRSSLLCLSKKYFTTRTFDREIQTDRLCHANVTDFLLAHCTRGLRLQL